MSLDHFGRPAWPIQRSLQRVNGAREAGSCARKDTIAPGLCLVPDLFLAAIELLDQDSLDLG
jgi:hypothetical protein